jgi:ribosomal protein L7/L12
MGDGYCRHCEDEDHETHLKELFNSLRKLRGGDEPAFDELLHWNQPNDVIAMALAVGFEAHRRIANAPAQYVESRYAVGLVTIPSPVDGHQRKRCLELVRRLGGGKSIHSTLDLLISAGHPYLNIFTSELVGTFSSADLLPALNDAHTASTAWALVLGAPHKHLVNILEAGAIPSAADLPKVVDALKRMRGKRARRALAMGFPDWENRVWNVILKDCGVHKTAVTLAVNRVTKLSGKELRTLVDSVPTNVKEGISSWAEAESIRALLTKYGATVEIVAVDNPNTQRC